ncbi:DUF2069 domain-containing protein [uncultured Oxalicibacterium sp.]|uniref:DUF2069 domain-containing protein n=1 Tax=uncultured Oxalicibacterium sp. TaxID=1168540 RepID=UPI0025E0A6D5|nr:DUF2069 domain-containing protein [uncultured Oxalicibacterium sp.]
MNAAHPPSVRQRVLHGGAIVSLIALIILCIAWETVLAPVREGVVWPALKALPLLLPLRGLLRRNLYTMQWSSMMILLYFMEGIVRGWSDTGLSALLGWAEVALVVLCFICLISYLSPYKKAARAKARSLSAEQK